MEELPWAQATSSAKGEVYNQDQGGPGVQGRGYEVKPMKVQILALPPSTCVAFDRSLPLSEPQCPHL